MKDPKPLNSLPVSRIRSVARADEIVSKANAFQLTTDIRSFFLYAESEEERENWLKILFLIIQSNKSNTSPNNMKISENEDLFSDEEDEDDDIVENDEQDREIQGWRYGFLFKCDRKMGNWQKRWVALDEQNLCYYRKQQDSKPAGIIALASVIAVNPASDITKKPFSMAVSTADRIFYFYAISAEQRDQWISAINSKLISSSQSIVKSIPSMNVPINLINTTTTTSSQPSQVISNNSTVIESPKLKHNSINNLENSNTNIREGYLWKTPGSKVKPGNWQRRWFVLTSNSILYYKAPKDPKPSGIIDLLKILEVRNEDEVTRTPNSLAIHTPDRIFFIYAPTPVERDEWISVIKSTQDILKNNRQ